MALIVQKYGGTSVGTVEKIKNVAKRVARTKEQGNDVVVVVSAMSGETNRLLGLAHQISEMPNERELDVVAATGEQVTIGLLAIALTEMGCKAKSFCGFQIPVLTDAAYVKARIRQIRGETITQALKEGYVAVVAGFQGIDDSGSITTLGRGGSDTSAVAVAAALRRTSARSTRTWTASTPPTRTSAPTPASSTRSPSRRCSSSPPWAPRCCRSARWSSG
jgi:aspartate kinase